MDSGNAPSELPSAGNRAARLRRAGDQVTAVTCGDYRFVDEFELIRRCFRDRTTRRAGTVLGIGDDAALLDTDGLPLAHAWATVPFTEQCDATGTARSAFGAALVRLAAQTVTPGWTTLALTFDFDDPDWIASFAAAAAAVCDACAVELIGGDTTRGPGRATVFALGAQSALPRRTGSLSPTTAVMARLSLAPARASERAIAELVSVCTDLATRGTELRFEDSPSTSDDAGAGVMELVARTDAAGMDALHAVAGRLRFDSTRFDPHE